MSSTQAVRGSSTQSLTSLSSTSSAAGDMIGCRVIDVDYGRHRDVPASSQRPAKAREHTEALQMRRWVV